jgi:hypothetical protein
MFVEFTLRNLGETEACVPREMRVTGSLDLRITLNGKPIPYVGRVVRLAEPGAHSFVCLHYQEFIGHRIDISPRSTTGFQITQPGHYQLHARLRNRDIEKFQARRARASVHVPLEAWEDPRCLPAEEGWESYWKGELTDAVTLRVEP